MEINPQNVFQEMAALHYTASSNMYSQTPSAASDPVLVVVVAALSISIDKTPRTNKMFRITRARDVSVDTLGSICLGEKPQRV